MRLVVPMYHLASAGPHGNAPAMLERHFALIARRFRCVLPGDALDPARTNVCLSFDDGTFDFYAVIFPLLKRHGLKALLAVPLAFVAEDNALADDVRLRACAGRGADGTRDGRYCTWAELREMVDSGTVLVAAHGLSHRRLDRGDVDLDAELLAPRTVLEARLGQAVDSLVLPYGRFTPRVLERARAQYRYVFRIGGADNRAWDSLVYRVDADCMQAPDALFGRRRRAAYALRRRWNRWRGR